MCLRDGPRRLPGPGAGEVAAEDQGPQLLRARGGELRAGLELPERAGRTLARCSLKAQLEKRSVLGWIKKTIRKMKSPSKITPVSYMFSNSFIKFSSGIVANFDE